MELAKFSKSTDDLFVKSGVNCILSITISPCKVLGTITPDMSVVGGPNGVELSRPGGGGLTEE